MENFLVSDPHAVWLLQVELAALLHDVGNSLRPQIILTSPIHLSMTSLFLFFMQEITSTPSKGASSVLFSSFHVFSKSGRKLN